MVNEVKKLQINYLFENELDSDRLWFQPIDKYNKYIAYNSLIVSFPSIPTNQVIWPRPL